MAKYIFKLLIGIYNSVRKIYDLFLSVAQNTDFGARDVMQNFDSLIDAIYVLCGVFMLFRITVSFLSMLIDPDRVNDKQAGAGSVIKRVFISIILLIICRPSNFCFGLFDKLEDAIVGEGGILENITEQLPSMTETEYVSYRKGFSIMFDDVYAADNIKCLYQAYSKNGEWGKDQAGKDSFEISAKPREMQYITFTKNTSGISIKSKWGTNSGWYIEFQNSGSIEGFKYDNSYLINDIISYKMNVSKIEKNYLSNGKCPPYISYEKSVAEFMNSNKYIEKYTSSYYSKTIPITNHETMLKKVQDELIQNMSKNYIKNRDGIDADRELLKYSTSLSDEDKETLSKNLAEKYLLVDDQATIFARSMLLSFTDQLDDSEDTANTLNTVLHSSEANNNVFKLMKGDNPKVDTDALMAIIFGIGLMVYLFILCVDLIVREFKLMMLKVMSPIPVICYIDPKDKVFSAWLKMFISVYVDLFIKLLCINLAVSILNAFLSANELASGFQKIMVIIAIFVFAKALPSIINKIFGIEASANSFKEIGKMAKTGLGIAAGGAIAGAATIGTGWAAYHASKGQGFGNRLLAAAGGVGRVATGTLRGMGGGARGNITAGLSAARTNMRNRQAYTDGVTASALTGATLFSGIGMDYASRKDREIQSIVADQERYNEFSENYKSKMESLADDSKFMSTLAAARSKNLITGTQYESIRDDFIAEQIAHAGQSNYKGSTYKQLLSKHGVSNMSAFEFNVNEQMTAEGKSKQMEALLKGATNYAKSNASVRTAIEKAGGTIEIQTYADLKNANTAVKDASIENQNKIDAVKNTDEYRKADSARKTANENRGK